MQRKLQTGESILRQEFEPTTSYMNNLPDASGGTILDSTAQDISRAIASDPET
jgi:hypothetical protein